MGLYVLIAALGVTGGVLAYVYGRALYRVGYWRGWEAHLELESRIDQIRAENGMRRVDLWARVERANAARGMADAEGGA